MITIDIDAKIDSIIPKALEKGMSSVFIIRDANNPDTIIHLTFYKKQMDYMLKQIYHEDRKRMRKEISNEFKERERKLKSQFQLEYSSLKEQFDDLEAEYRDFVKSIGEVDASPTD